MVPSRSVEAAASKITGTPGFTARGVAVNAATGPAFTSTVPEARLVREPLSVTVTVTTYVPEAGYWWMTGLPEPRFPSPKSQSEETMNPSGSMEAEASKVRSTPGFTAVGGVAVKAAAGGVFTRTLRVAVSVAVPLSVTVSVTTNVPEMAYGWFVVTPVPKFPSPKSQS